MNSMIKPIAPNEASFNVALLHKALDLLGLPVSKKEVEQNKAGPDTRKQTRALQKRLNIPADQATVADEATLSAMAEALKKRGALDASREFIVGGTVRLPDGTAKKRQRLLAFDLDLSGVAVYRSVEGLAAIRKSAGFEFLGETSSDGHGAYRITFYDWQYQRAERKKADVVVYAVEEATDDGRILGRSRIVSSDDYAETGLAQNVDVFITVADERTEYEVLMATLDAFLEENGTMLRAIATSSEQLAFVAGELDVELARVGIAAGAELLGRQETRQRDKRLSHEMLYGLGRQNVLLAWSALRREPEAELRAAIDKSARERIIRAFPDKEINAFVQAVHEYGIAKALEERPDGGNALNALLSNALPEARQRAAFMNAVGTFSGADYREFWTEHVPAHPEFRDNPRLVASVQLTQQLALLTGNHQALVNELQVNRGVAAAHELLELDNDHWLQILRKTGVPDLVEGANAEEKAQRYAERMQDLLNAAFPTRRIAIMVDAKELPIERSAVSRGITGFLRGNEQFDFATSRIHDFEYEIKAAAGAEFGAVRQELMKLQRVFQVSPSPRAMKTLMESGLTSAYTIAKIPLKSFMNTHGGALGGEEAAFTIHQRAMHIATRAEIAAMRMMDYSHGVTPRAAMGPADYSAVLAVIQTELPNYSTLFGSPDLCECEHCRSVYSAAAYFVDLLRFLWRGTPNSDARTPLDMLAARRPDLLHLPLTCENTNTVIPYIDLANEVMEYYTANNSLTAFEGYDTGEATAEELRANPQNFDLEAYRKLKDAKYPFALPYHQPLDVIRAYSDHLRVSRYEALKAMNPEPDATTATAIAAESLRLSEEEHKVLTGTAFDGTVDATALHQHFGYAAAGQLEGMSGVPEFLLRSGVAYTDLVELVKTRFINPHHGTLDFLQKIFESASIDASSIYAKLKQIAAGALDPAADAAVSAALAAYNAAHETGITPAQFGQWVTDQFDGFLHVITLYHPESKCELENTKLRTIESIYEASATSGLSSDNWSRIHRFIRLWRKLGWTIHETDLMLAALGENDITASTIGKLESVAALKASSKLALNQLAVLWGGIDTYGKKSLYRKLFLNKAVQQIDPAFEADAWGDYMADTSEVLADHQSTILAAFRIREEDLAAILEVAAVMEGGNPRPINLAADALNLANLSTIYRHAVLAKALKLRVADLCKLIALFAASPFSTWDIDQQEFTGIAPDATNEFYRVAAAARASGFKVAVLEYILQGTLPPESSIGLDRSKMLRTIAAIRGTFSAIAQEHPEVAPSPLAAEVLAGKLGLTFGSEVVARFVGLLEGTASFEAATDMNLGVTIPEAMSEKYAYVKGSGRLSVVGVMSDDERTALKALANVNASFEDAVDELYVAPEVFIAANFDGIFDDLAEANATLLDHPEQPVAATPEEKRVYVYHHFVPVLKTKLRRDAVTQHIASLIGLSNAATAVLIAGDIEALVTDLSAQGLSGTYFSDATWTTAVLSRTDAAVDFDWGAAAPDPALPANNFSARWEAYIAAPASGEYTLVVDVEEADEVFKLHLDDSLVLEKTGADADTSWEVVVSLNAAKMPRLKLEYAEIAQNAGVRLRWKTATTGLEVLPPPAAYPAAIVDATAALATAYHRAAKLISGFKLSETELDHLIAFSADFGGIDFKALTVEHWKRMNDYVALRNAVPQASALLTDVFAAASTADPAPVLDDLTALLHQASAWDETNLAFLVDTHFSLGVADFRNEVALNHLREVMRIVARTGLSAQTIAEWGAAETDFDALNVTAQRMKNTVKARYGEEDWLDIAGDLSDKIRENQKQALVGYLLTRPAIRNWGAKDADGLFEYFLIDVQMSACMDTSRIVQANASVQMFVNRSLLNLESETSTGAQKGVSPGAIDKDRWEWMKNYRVWEANRKVFLYPENWLEPEWRNDRSEFFKELESYLVQNDITDRSVEQAFRNYLASLNEVANLEVCGMCRENYADGTLKYLHVFGRTNNAPYKFYYRTWNTYRKWSAWRKVGVDVRCVEAGDSSGVHMIPVVWKSRLFLFWPEFMEKQEEPATNSNQSVEAVSDDKMSTLQPLKHWEIRLAWSEYVEGKWTPKQVSKEFIKQEHHWYIPGESAMRFATETDNENNLYIYLATETTDPREWYLEGRFALSDITSNVVADSGGWGWAHEQWVQTYSTNFMNVAGYSKLQLLGDTYLKNSTYHKLLLTAETGNFDPAFTEPFFFTALKRAYFVRPVTISRIGGLKEPGRYVPYLPGLVDDSKFRIPVKIPPPVGPDDFLPSGGGFARRFAGPRVGPDDYVPVELVTRTSRGRASFGGVPVRNAMEAGPASAAMSMASGEPAAWMSYGKSFAKTEAAFGALKTIGYRDAGIWSNVIYDTGLEFHTFYHPFSSKYVENLNQIGLPGLMQSDTSIPSDQGSTFVAAYNPNFVNGFVQKPSDFAVRTYYKENVCFDVYGANSLYNWELFFHAPLYIATRLSKNGKFEEAMKWFHYIFDPTTDESPAAGQSETSRYWKVLPFKTTAAESLEDWFRSLLPNANPNTENAIIAEWRDNPFDPHLVASNRPLAYMKHVVLKYVENLVAWGDSLFRQDTMESVNEALQLYVVANHVLGPRPQFVPKRGEIKAESYDSLEAKWDDFSNALVELENIFPYASEASVGSSATGTSLLGIGTALYFCIPPNEKLLESWDTVTDRLYKIRHCQNIEGVERKLALFAPPIDPGALIQAASQGLSLGSILADLSSPPPIYRFTHLIQMANEFCTEVKALGSALLATLEKKDAEELARLRASQETQMLELMTAIKDRQVLDAKAYKESLLKARETAALRLEHYIDLLGNDSVTIPAAPTLSATLTADSQLPADTLIATVATDVDESLVDGAESGVKLVPKEKEALDKNEAAKWTTLGAGAAETLAAIFSLFPQLDAEGTPLGVGAGAWWGGQNLGAGTSALARAASTAATFLSQEAAQATVMATYIRREQEWTLQANLAARDAIQLDKQITSADIRIQIAEKELENHEQEIENSKAVELFLKDKFTNQELYQWMKEQLYAVYKQSYDLAYGMAKKAEKAYRYEMGTELASFIQYGYWDSSQQGLAAGEKLQLALRQLQKSYVEENRRELELTKSISLARVNPLALIQLRESGKCRFSIPEELFDLDFRGHYFRRIKAMSLSLPCMAGPQTSVSCSLRLLNNSFRINTSMNSAGDYEHENDEGAWTDDDRFRASHVPVTSIATSIAQNDSGMFQFDFRDERYLPFEGAGAISEWQVELSTEKELRQFDYATISDVILHMNYTARESGGLFKESAAAHVTDFIANAADLSQEPLMQIFSMKHEFPTEWYRFLHPAAEGGEQVLGFKLGKERFPFFAQDREIVAMKLDVLARSTQVASYHLLLSYVNRDADPVDSAQITMPPNDSYGGLNKVTLGVNDAGLSLDEMDVDAAMSLRLKRSTAPDYTGLATQPEDEIGDVYAVVHYRLG